MKKVLIGCECSGIVREAFRIRGFDAWSCDLKDAEDSSEFHLKRDVREAIAYNTWDLIIAHPDCTALTVAGNGTYAKGKEKHYMRLEAAIWTEDLWSLAKSHSPRVCFENPVGVLSTLTKMGKAKYIQPYDFGHNASKKTGLWLHNLPPLQKVLRIEGRFVNGKERWDNQTDSGQNKLGPSKTRAADRSRTYTGIAEAMASQWGPLLKGEEY